MERAELSINLYERQFSNEFDCPEYQGTPAVLLIASTGRSGSHLLGHTLQRTGVFGAPFEYFNSRNRKRWESLLGTSTADELMKVLMKRRTTENGVFSLKLHFSHLQELGGAGMLRLLLPAPRVIFLRRRDTVRQAISLVRAQQTDAWIEGQAELRSPFYDFDRILATHSNILRDNMEWERTLALLRFSRFDLDFEEFLKDRHKVIEDIAHWMDVRLPDKCVEDETPIARQSDEKNNAWYEHFFDDLEHTEVFAGMSNSSGR